MSNKKKWISWLWKIGVGIILLFFILILLLRTHWAQNLVSDKVMSILSERYGNSISIGDVKVDFFDEISLTEVLISDRASDTLLYSKNIEVDILLFSWFKKNLEIERVYLNHPTIKLKQYSDSTDNYSFLFQSDTPQSLEKESQTKKNWNFTLDEIEADKFNLQYINGKDTTQLLSNELFVDVKSIDMKNNRLIFDQFKLSDGSLKVNQNEEKTKEITSFSLPELGIDLIIRNTQISNFEFIHNSIPNNLTQINGNIAEFEWNQSGLSGLLETMALEAGPDLVIDKITASISIKGDSLTLENTILETKNDSFEGKIFLNLSDPSIGDLKQAKVFISAQSLKKWKSLLPEKIKLLEGVPISLRIPFGSINNHTIFLNKFDANYGRDISYKGMLKIDNYSNPELIKINATSADLRISTNKMNAILMGILPAKLMKYPLVKLNGNYQYSGSEIIFNEASLILDENNYLSLSGKIDNYTDRNNIVLDINIKNGLLQTDNFNEFNTSALQLDSLKYVSFTGKIDGPLENLHINGNFNSALGKLDSDINLKIEDNIEALEYKGNLKFRNFDLGALIDDKKFGNINLDLDLEGKGLDINNIDSKINGRLQDFDYQGVVYDLVNINAEINNCLINGKLNIQDDAVVLNYDGIIDLQSENIRINFTSNIDTIDFAKLNLIPSRMQFRGKIEADLTLPLSKQDPGFIKITDFILTDSLYSYIDDSLGILFFKKDNKSIISLISDFATIDLSGNYFVRDLPQNIADLTDYYLMHDLVNDSLLVNSENNHLDIKGKVFDLAPLSIFLPNTFIEIGTGTIEVGLDFDSKQINGSFYADTMVYNDAILEELNIGITTSQSQLSIRTDSKNTSYGRSIYLPSVTTSHLLDTNLIKSQFDITETDGTPRASIGTSLSLSSDPLELVLNEKIILNNETWNISPSNSIKFLNGKVDIDRFDLYKGNKSMKIYSSDSEEDNMTINFTNFNVNEFTDLILENPLNLTGNLNGKIEIRDIYSNFHFLLNTKVEDIFYDNKKVGSVLLTANENEKTGIISGTVDLIGDDNDILGSGSFNPSTRILNWDIIIGLMEMRLLDPFLEGIITNSKGIMYGEIGLHGSLDNPDISGQLEFEDISTKVEVNNATYQFDRHKIDFNNKEINIGRIVLKDISNNEAVVTGKIYHNYYSDFNLDFKVQTEKFTFLNTNSKINPIFYGSLILDADIDIKGPPDLLEVKAVAKALDSSEITLSPFSETESILKEDFIRYGKPTDLESVSQNYLKQLSRLYPFEVEMQLEVDEKSNFTFIVDPLSGDRLSCKGRGNLKIILKPNGEQEIYGNYIVSSGKYNFYYGDFINKNFALKPGGNIRFNGNPLNAVLNVEAVYSTKASPYELIKNEGNLTNSEIADAKTRTQIDVLLDLEGNLLNPEISLDIEIPELQAGSLVSGIERKLGALRTNENELNNQVVSLLIFNSFAASGNSISGINNVGENLALSSLSSLITNQLNKLASDLIKGVDVKIDVSSYNSAYVNNGEGGTVTEIGLNVSKQFLDNRVSVSVGGNFNLDDSSLSNGDFSSFAGDFVLEYKLTENGNYRLRVFSKSNFDRLLNQNTSRNGVSIFFTKEFDSKTDDNN